MAQLIDRKWLEGLTFHGSKKGKDGGKFIPTERPLEPEDVLSFNETAKTVAIVAADGQKYVVDKAAAKAAEKKPADGK